MRLPGPRLAGGAPLRQNATRMRILVALVMSLALALFGMGRFAGAHAERGVVIAAYHQASAHGDAAHGHHAHAAAVQDHAAGGAPPSGKPCDGASACCSFACHILSVDFVALAAAPDFALAVLTPQDSASLRGNAPSGLDRPPRTA